ncbi:hypothetical protein V7654_16985 [Bacillus sp. JJ1609]
MLDIDGSRFASLVYPLFKKKIVSVAFALYNDIISSLERLGVSTNE